MQLQAGLRNKESGDRWISFAVCFQVLLVGMKNMLIQAFEGLYEANDVLNIVLFVAVGFAYVMAFVSLGSRMLSFTPLSLCLVAFLLLTFSASALIHPHGLAQYGTLLAYILPFGFLTAFMLTWLTTLDWIAYYMERFAYVIILTALVCVIAILNTGHTTTSEWSTYSMSLSNVIMVGVIWLLYCYFEKHRFSALIGALLGVVAILLCGSRNPLLAIVAYVVVKTVLKVVSKQTPNRERWIYVIWAALMCLFFLFFESIVDAANYLLNTLGIYSRTIGLLESDLFFDSGRDAIHATLIETLNQSPFIGLGVGGDIELIDWAAHNFYLSVLSTYGYLIGCAVLVVMAVLILRAYRKSRGTAREVLLLYLCLFLPRSFTGNDIWRSDVPWWLIGMSMVVLSRSYVPREKSPVSGEEEGV